jgi:hypothetical protein
MTNFDYYIKGGKARDGWYDFANNFYDKGTGRAIDRYNEWLLEEHKEPPILDDVEREYLSNVIKPFRNRVVYIAKVADGDGKSYHISVKIHNNFRLIFPCFGRSSKMYKNMKPNRCYTLTKLNL